jgi:hypothetical protein
VLAADLIAAPMLQEIHLTFTDLTDPSPSARFTLPLLASLMLHWHGRNSRIDNLLIHFDTPVLRYLHLHFLDQEVDRSSYQFCPWRQELWIWESLYFGNVTHIDFRCIDLGAPGWET